MASRITYTLTDEAPALATYSLLPILKRFLSEAGIEVEYKDISLAARILAQFPEKLPDSQIFPNALQELGDLTKSPDANIIKLPNISASMPQLLTAIKELQKSGFAIPDYPVNPKNEEENKIRERYEKVKGSAVNPVLREGNSDRRAPKAVKEFVRKYPHKMGEWSKESKSHVVTMGENDFATNEQSICSENDQKIKIEFHPADGSNKTVKKELSLLKGEVIDATYLSKSALVAFLKKQKQLAKEEAVLFSLHMKATMMKVSDPIIFGYALEVFFADVFEKHRETLTQINANSRNGLASMIDQIEKLPKEQKDTILHDIHTALEEGPDVAMVNSDKGITNLHVPSDVIIDASMPAMIRTSGKMWNKDGQEQDAKAIIPDSSYADLYQETIRFCKENGAFDPKTMGTVPNVGLMAKKAEEYGSHDKTFEIESAGVMKVIGENGKVLMEHKVEEGDIWRMCQTKDAAITNWVELAVNRARATNWPTIFWLDEKRAHDAQLIKKVKVVMQNLNTDGLDIRIMPVSEATLFTLKRLKNGENTISVTGNVLRDYLTDLFPILELGTSAKMLSIVPLLNGGGLFETGAGGSAPKHVQQFITENHLRWDSLGEFLALSASLEHLAEKCDNDQAKILADCLDEATEKLLMNGKSPSRKVKEIDNRGSHFYLALYWAEALSKQTESKALQDSFTPLAKKLAEQESSIINELNQAQGVAVDMGGYYVPDKKVLENKMRPSQTFNDLLE